MSPYYSILTSRVKTVSTTPAMTIEFTEASHILGTPFGLVHSRFFVCSFMVTVCYVKDTYRAEWSWLILFAPERLPGMITSMLQDYKEVG
jgi:hypothetical protein